MKKQNLLKLAFTMMAMFIMTGAMAQIDITVKQADGTAAAAATIHTVSSSDATSTLSAALATANGTGVFVGFTPVAGTNYIIQNAAGTQRNGYSAPAVPAAITITLRTEFALTIQDYVANHTGDKITHTRPMPFWVYPSPIHNTGWSAPGGAYETGADIIAGLSSSFAWTLNGGATGGASNYVEVTAAGDLTAAVTTTANNTLEATETAAPAFGGCAADPVRIHFTTINPPYANLSNTAASALTIGGSAVREFGRGCEGDAALDVNPEVSFPNTNEEFPYYVRLNYTVHNATISGSDITLGGALTFPASLRPQSEVETPGTPADANQTTNPMEFNASPSNFYGAAQTFVTINNDITVYMFDLNEWNAKISRKSDYIKFRDNQPGADNTDVNDAQWSWYSNAAIANTFDASGYYKVAYVIVFPKPVTGPIYHVPNTWGL